MPTFIFIQFKQVMKKYAFLFLLLSMFFIFIAQSGNKYRIEIKDGQFVYDEEAVWVISGEMHYTHIPQQY